MSADCGKLENSNHFRCAHKGDFPKIDHNYIQIELHNVETYAKIDQFTVTVLIYMA